MVEENNHGYKEERERRVKDGGKETRKEDTRVRDRREKEKR